MPVVSILSTPYCNGREIAAKLAAETNFKLIKDEVINKVSVKYDVHVEKLLEAINGSSSFFKMNEKERRKYIFLIKEAVANEIAENDSILLGFTSHLIPRDISHVLKICLTADIKFRIDNVMREKHLSENEARKLIKSLDKNLFNWTDFIYKTNPWDVNLYDIIIPVHKKSIGEIITMLSVNLAKDVLEESAESKQKMEDFVLAAKVNAFLAKRGHDVDVVANKGRIMILLRKYYLRLEHYKNELIELVEDLDGIKKVEVKMGPSFNMNFMHIPVEFDVPQKTLLVDDEKEFVETLSERLKSRNIVSMIAYDGEEALNIIKTDKPEVMVLDLKMPGMGGLDVLKKVKDKYPAIEVIILTGHGSEQEKEEAQRLGAFEYLEKPVDINTLSQVMKNAYQKINDEK